MRAEINLEFLQGQIVDRDSNVPKYEQVKSILLKFIKEHEGDSEIYLPYEYEIENHLKVAKITVRRALQELRNDGMIETIRNRGSKVLSKSKSPHRLTEHKKHVKKNIVVLLTHKMLLECRGAQSWEFISQIHELEQHYVQKNGKFIYVKYDTEDWLRRIVDINPHWIITEINKTSFSTIYQKIKPYGFSFAVHFPTTQSYHECSKWMYRGSGVITNCAGAIYDTLQTHFSQNDFYYYISPKQYLNWAQERAMAVEQHAQDKNAGYIFRVCPEEQIKNVVQSDLQKFKSARKPCIVAANDFIATLVIKALREVNFEAPHDYEIIGYDNDYIYTGENITTFEHNVKGCLQSLLQLIEGDSKDQTPLLYVHSPQYLPRSTTKN